MPANIDVTLPLPAQLPVAGKLIIDRCDGGLLSSDGGLLVYGKRSLDMLLSRRGLNVVGRLRARCWRWLYGQRFGQREAWVSAG
jgi:hypothetical protein